MAVQICNECGESVAPGSGRFVNRVIDMNDPETRREMGKPYPEGDYVCEECDRAHDDSVEHTQGE
jgi:hypothetical protein